MSNEQCADTPETITVTIFISQHCQTCGYAHEVAESIRRDYPQIRVRLVDVHDTAEAIPDAVFATPTYWLNGKIWSLGNPSAQKIAETLKPLVAVEAG